MVQYLASQSPSAWDEQRLLAGLQSAGYAAATPDPTAGRFTCFDTRDGALSRSGRDLRREEGSGSWLLFEDGRLAAVWTGEEPPADRLPAFARLLPLLRAELAGQTWTLRSPAAPPIRIRLESWRVSSALDPAERTACLQLLSLSNSDPDIAGPVPVEIAYLAGLLAQRLGLEPLSASLLALALPALAVAPPWAPPPLELRPAASDAPALLIRKILAAQALELRRNSRGALLDLDPEFLHDLRVATRRARTALRLFAPLLDPERAAYWSGELAWIGSSVGPVRDLDVFLQLLSGQLERSDTPAESRQRLLARLRERRQALREPLAECLSSERYRQLVDALAGLLQGPADLGPPAPPTTLPAAPPAFARETIAPLVARLRRTAARAADQPDAATLHRLRIRLKRLRYACEFFTPQLGPVLGREARRLVGLQDCLGSGQDAASALAALEELAAQSRSAPPQDILALGALMQVEREVRRESAQHFQSLGGKLPALLARIERILEGGA